MFVFYGYDMHTEYVRFSARVLVTGLAALLMLPACALLLLVLTRRGLRGEATRALKRPLVTLFTFTGAYLALFGGLSYLTVGLRLFNTRRTYPLPGVPSSPEGWLAVYGLVLLTVTVLALIPAAVYGAVSVWLVLRHLFNAIDGHLLLPAMLAPCSPWALAMVDLRFGYDPRLPLPLAVMISIGSPVAITGLSVWEVRRLRHDYGVTWRGGVQHALTRQR
ncbi:hypothetical protein J7F03_00260 [Streptomyces sp. ISL-43]|uniref:hypothetical protein n=1 Tax=Streptomyces sp. ISL-43 TaxID=2819183 RepID=UPI001BEBE37E|nr:hypothetical protein [Streptomyces sp. ISL-43]MBT2445554.1 hypothetical protein [Streptomyces sp. ISL-43]